ncbi:hypothetical protein BKA70DRAFT_1354839 [Coprinopsis sp. MPI-PUGE-AT-0042]|nr:hypothetical protein BKA70DRAFT_1354839 [Coprinopsis sp. MPI-PUGE-AT-0042]
MANSGLETGIYAIVNAGAPQWTVDTKESEVVANFYIGSPSQQWRLESSDGICLYIQNIGSGRYLGLPLNENAKNGLALREVDHKFAWHIERQGYQRFLLKVPYTPFVIDLDPKVTQPSMTNLCIQERHLGPLHVWILCKDLHLETSSILKDRRTYKILNAHYGGAMTVTNDHKVVCLQSGDREDQMFQAVKTENGWGFRNANTKQFLSMPHTIAFPDDSLQVNSAAMGFAWIVVPLTHHTSPRMFQIWIPFTQMVLIQQGNGITPTHVSQNTAYTSWKFKEMPTPWQEEGLASECVTGERRPGEE